MRRLAALYLIVCTLLFGAMQCFGQMLLTGVGSGNSTNSAYTGPGDVVSGAITWYGLRAYSANKTGTNAANICNSTGGVDVLCVNMATSATGNLILSLIGGISCASLGSNCTVKTLYDQTGALKCVGATTACDVTNATIATRPTLLPNCIGSLPCLSCPGGKVLQSPTGPTQAQPYSAAGVAQRSGAFTTIGTWLSDYQNLNSFAASANTAYMNAGTAFTKASVPDSAFHAIQNVFNGASSSISVDSLGTSTGNAGANAFNNGQAMNVCNDGFALSLTGFFAEGGFWPVAFSAGQIANLNSNQHTYWGF